MMKKKNKTTSKPAKKKPAKVTVKSAKKAGAKVVTKKQKEVAEPVKKLVVKAVKKTTVKGVSKPMKQHLPLRKNFTPQIPVLKIEEPKPRGLYSIEYELNSSPDVLFEFISTPGGLEKWFAERVYIIEGNYVFNWENGEKRLAKQIAVKEKEWVRYHWLDEPEKRYFEFRIQIDDLTSEVALIVSDFADNARELEESTRLWNQQMQDLHYSIGSP